MLRAVQLCTARLGDAGQERCSSICTKSMGPTVWRKAQMMELMTSCSCWGDMAKRVAKQLFGDGPQQRKEVQPVLRVVLHTQPSVFVAQQGMSCRQPCA